MQQCRRYVVRRTQGSDLTAAQASSSPARVTRSNNATVPPDAAGLVEPSRTTGDLVFAFGFECVGTRRLSGGADAAATGDCGQQRVAVGRGGLNEEFVLPLDGARLIFTRDVIGQEGRFERRVGVGDASWYSQ
jgi:hypothetical protein